MATVAEIKAGRRADLDALLVENDLDPAEYKTVDDARKVLLPLASDANGEGEGAGEGEGEGEGSGEPETANLPQNDADVAANSANEASVASSDHTPANFPNGFDKTGQPIFGLKAEKDEPKVEHDDNAEA